MYVTYAIKTEKQVYSIKNNLVCPLALHMVQL